MRKTKISLQFTVYSLQWWTNRKPFTVHRSLFTVHYLRLFLLFIPFLFLLGCEAELPETAVRGPIQVSLTVDGETYNLNTEATNVREL
ncbi:MAG: hypothetical protein R6X34_20145, partial [Chloroflexota bacterium]